jgi:response regulator of citrate/malate metabolism
MRRDGFREGFMGRGLKRVLIVEDDLSLRPLWENFFAVHYSRAWIDWAVSCEQAMVMILEKNKERKKYHLIISDIFLAGSGTGIDLIKSKAVRDSGAKTVLVSSAARDEVLKQYGHLLPDTAILNKPLDLKNNLNILLENETVAA